MVTSSMPTRVDCHHHAALKTTPTHLILEPDMSTPNTSPQIGFIGTGLIGTPMVERLLERGLSVTIWNRTTSKLAPLIAAGAIAATSARQLAGACDIVCLCLTDTKAVHQIMFNDDLGIAAAMRTGQLVIDLSSIAPAATRDIAQRLAREAGARWLDAPVSGGLAAARKGTLTIFAGGTEEALAQAAPVLQGLAARVTHLGDSGAGQLAKSCNQMLVACNIAVIAEMLAFARKSGIAVERLPQALAGGFADSLPLQFFGPRMAGHITEPPLGAIATMLKDIDQVARLAREIGASAPMAGLASELYRQAALRPDIGAQADLCALIRLYEP
jgi:3-hydroxyisobutyrate dehydrogenase